MLSVETPTIRFTLFLALISTFLLIRERLSLARSSLGSCTPCGDLLHIHVVLMPLLGWRSLHH